MNNTLGFIGAGNMAGAIINGITCANLLSTAQIGIYDISEVKRVNYKNSGFTTFLSAGDLTCSCRYIVLSVKPQSFADLLAEISPFATENTVFISIAAGISIGYIKQLLGYNAKVIRVMPNTPLLIGRGTAALSRENPVTDEEFRFANEIFASAGTADEISTALMNEVIPLNGSSPAYIYLFAKIFVEQAVTVGFDYDTANRLFCGTLIGSAHMMLESGKTHQELIDMVTSPNGTTFEGLCALERNQFEKSLTECFADTVRRAYELTSNN